MVDFQKMYEDMAAPTRERAKGDFVYCRKCRRHKQVDHVECLQKGWPECCGQTMTIDPPSSEA